MNLKQEFETICKKYIDAFCEKHELDFEFWVTDNPGTVAYVGDMYLNFDDIRFDIDTGQPNGMITDWYWDSIDNEQFINYSSYTKGARWS